MNNKRKENAKFILGGSLIAFGLLTSGCGGSSSSSNNKSSRLPCTNEFPSKWRFTPTSAL